MPQSGKVRIGTRGSQLAQWQAGAVRDALMVAQGLPSDAVEIVIIRTSGDRIQDRPLSEAGGKGLFTKEIEEALLSESVDIAVHSAKDMETFLPPGLMVGACLPREDVRDALISRGGVSLATLPREAVVGTASLRREALLRRARPDLRMTLLRGNVPTRLKRVEAGDFDATLLALAGLKRLGLERHAAELLPLASFPPACGQGVVAIECREADRHARDLLTTIDDENAARALSCERAFLAALEGSCRTPIAGHARMEEGRFRFDGIILSEDGVEFYEASGWGESSDAVAIGTAAAEEILGRAPRDFLQRLGMGR